MSPIDSPEEEICLLTSDLDVPRLTLDPLFRRFMSHWNDGPTLDAAYFALEAMQICAPRQLISRRMVASLQSLLRACYLPREGGFWTSPFGDTASLYGTICAIGVMKSLQQYGCAQRPGDSPADCRAFFDSQIGDSFVAKLPSLLQSRVVEEGGFFDSKAWFVPCVISCSVASSIMWNAGYATDDFFRIAPAPKLKAFLEGCLLNHVYPPVHWQAFKPYADHNEPGVSVTYHALKLISRLGLDVLVDKEALRNFIKLCWTGRGFSSTIGGSPSLISTYYALACLQEDELCGVDEVFLSLIGEKVRRFVDECCVDSVYSVAPGFFPTTASTRYAVQVISRLQKLGSPDMQLTADALLKNFSKDSVGFTAYPIRVMERTSRTYGVHGFVGSLVGGLAAAVAPLRLMRRVLRAAWAHREV